MGAANALAAYRLYAGKVPPTSLAVIVYMSLVSLDRHPEPSWWEGHDMVAIRCFGYTEPVSEAGRRAVRRAITPLAAVGAITTIRHGSATHGRTITVRYRLWLDQPAQDGNRPKQKACTGRKASALRTKNGRAQDGNRPTKEKEEETSRSKTTGVPSSRIQVEGNDADSSQDNEVDLRMREMEKLATWIREHPEAAS